MVDEPGQPVGDGGTAAPGSDHGHGGVDVEPRGEHRHAAQQGLVGGIEQVVAPSDRVPERAVPPSRVAAHGEEPQPLVQTGFQSVEAQRRVAGRGQFDRQRHPVQCLAQRTDSAGVGHRLAGGLVDACREQLDRVGHREPGHREQALVRQEQPGAGRRQHRDLGTRGHDLLDAVANAVEQMLAVVQHEDSVAASQRCDQRGVRRRRPLLGRAHDFGHGTDDRRRIRQPHEVDEPGAVAPHRSEIGGDADRQTALADPAGTDRRDEAVLGRAPPSSAARSAARPMNGVTGTGSTLRAGCSDATCRANERRSGSCVLRSSAATCASTVRTEMNSSAAIWAFVRCRPTSARTSDSRAVTAVPTASTVSSVLLGSGVRSRNR